MENLCDVNRLDASEVLLPPRKRLLAGLKKLKQNYDGGVVVDSPSVDVVASCVEISEANSSSLSSFSSEFEARLKNLLNSHSKNPNPNPTPEEVVKASKVAAVNASKAAKVARAVAEEKAEIAAKAIAAAKNALDLVASFSEEATSGITKERSPKKNKLKKHLSVQLLYKNDQPIENCRIDEDEEFARNLHRSMNSSTRISKGNKPKKLKRSSSLEITEVSDSDPSMAFGQDCLSFNNGNAKIDSEGSIHEVVSSKENKKGFRYHHRSNQMEIDHEEAESSQSMEKKNLSSSIGKKKRGRVKLKKLPLSMLTSKDRVHPNECVRARNFPLTEMNTGNDIVSNETIH